MLTCHQTAVGRRSPVLLKVSIMCCVLWFACTAGSAEQRGNAKIQDTPRIQTVPVTPQRELRFEKSSSKSAPVSLTAADGTGLQLLTYDVRAVLQGPLAFTELRLTFLNPENRVREGHFEITLPPGAAISRFAMKIRNAWQEAEVVERQQARRTYEAFLHQRQDPALLEKKAGNQFRARVFPIAPKAKKEIIVSWSAETHRHPYTLYVAGLPAVNHFDVAITDETPRQKKQRFGIHKRQFAPTGDLLLTSSHSPGTTHWSGLQSDDLRVVTVTPRFKDGDTDFSHLTILFDTSASRTLGYDRQVKLAASLPSALKKERNADFPMSFVCFDQTVRTLYQGPASGFDKGVEEQIIRDGALGASNLELAIQWVKGHPHPNGRVLLITDGITTAGTEDSAKLKKQVLSLAEHGVMRMDAVATGGIRSEMLLNTLVTAGLPESGVVLDDAMTAKNISQKLLRAVRTEIGVQTTGAQWVWPTRLKGVQSGDSFLIYMGAPKDAEVTVKLDLPGYPFEKVPFHQISRPLLERSGAIAQIEKGIASLGEIDDAMEQEALRRQIVDLSIAHRVLSDYTALLVLESEWDYQRFHIDRNALSEILTVDQNGVKVMSRSNHALPTQNKPIAAMQKGRKNAVRGIDAPRSAHRDVAQRDIAVHDGVSRSDLSDTETALGALMGNQVGENFGYGGLGLKGAGRGGGGMGEGTIGLGNLNTIGHGAGGQGAGSTSGAGYGRGAGGLGGRMGPVPRVRSGAAMVTGNLSKEVIRRMVRRHLNEVKFCYERELADNPQLEGRVIVKFVISASGRVSRATLESTTLNDDIAETCIANAVQRWVFPRPKDGSVVVVYYPFQLTAQSPNGNAIAEATDRATDQPQRLPPIFSETRLQRIAQKNRQRATAMAYTGNMLQVMTLLQQHRIDAAAHKARDWHRRAPADLLAYVALGEVFEAKKMTAKAARAYGSIIDLYPSRADMRRMAGERLERVGADGTALAIDTFKKAVAQRPDHPSSHRLYAWSLFRNGEYKRAILAMHKGISYSYPIGRFNGVVDALKKEEALMYALWQRKGINQSDMNEMKSLLRHVEPFNGTTTRFVLHWESDANDVDLHVYDNRNHHAFYGNLSLPGGGRLAADVTDGYGPEFFTVAGDAPHTPYALQAHYYNRGAMGYGMGTLHVIAVDKAGNVSFDFRPFVVMTDQAFVGLGMVGS